MSNSRKSNYPKTFLQKMFLQVSCMTLNKLYSSPASISLPVEWQQQNCFPRQPPGLQEVMYGKGPCSNARRTLGTKQKLISMLWKCWLESMPLKTSAMWKISISTWISKQRKLDDGSGLTLAQMKPSVRMQRVTGLYGAPSSGRRAGHGVPSNWSSRRTRENDRMETVPSPLHYNFSTAREPIVTPSVRFTSKRELSHTHNSLSHQGRTSIICQEHLLKFLK